MVGLCSRADQPVTDQERRKAFNKLLERIQEDWIKVRQETVNRHCRLQTCMELNRRRKYDDGSQETYHFLKY